MGIGRYIKWEIKDRIYEESNVAVAGEKFEVVSCS